MQPEHQHDSRAAAKPPLELADEGPGFTRDPALALALVLLCGIVIPAMRTPAHGMAFRATFIRSANVRTAVCCRRRRVLRSAAVEGHVAVAKRQAGLRKVQDRIAHAVSVKIRDGCRASIAA